MPQRPTQHLATFRQVDESAREVFGLVAIPCPVFDPGTVIPRSQYEELKAIGAIHYDGGAWSLESVRKMAHRFMVQSQEVDQAHDHKIGRGLILESALYPDLDNAWGVRTKVQDDDAWSTVMGSEESGYSIWMVGPQDDVSITVDNGDGTSEDIVISYFTDPTPLELSLVGNPAHNQSFLEVLRAVSRERMIEIRRDAIADLPLADRDQLWDSEGARKRVRAWASSEVEENGETRTVVDWTRYGKAFFWHSAEPTSGEDFKLPFADVIEGKLTAIPQAFISAGAVIQGAMGGVDLSDADRAAVRDHISAYYHKAGLIPPWEDLPQERSMNTSTNTNTAREDQTSEVTESRFWNWFRSKLGMAEIAREDMVAIEPPTFNGAWQSREFEQDLNEASWTLRDVISEILRIESVEDKKTNVLTAIDQYRAAVAAILDKGPDGTARSKGIDLSSTIECLPEVLKHVERAGKALSKARTETLNGILERLRQSSEELGTLLKDVSNEESTASTGRGKEDHMDEKVVTELKTEIAELKGIVTQMVEAARSQDDSKANGDGGAAAGDETQTQAEESPEVKALRSEISELKQAVETMRAMRPAPLGGSDEHQDTTAEKPNAWKNAFRSRLGMSVDE